MDQCYKTTELIAEKMGLDSEEILTVFQSKFGFEPWVGPGLEDEIMYIAKEKKSVDVACPGFSTDGLETLEEVRIEAREIYEGNFGPRFSYIPALNDKDIHIKALGEIIPDKMKEG